MIQAVIPQEVFRDLQNRAHRTAREKGWWDSCLPEGATREGDTPLDLGKVVSGIPEKLADVQIRLWDLVGALGIEIEHDRIHPFPEELETGGTPALLAFLHLLISQALLHHVAFLDWGAQAHLHEVGKTLSWVSNGIAHVAHRTGVDLRAEVERKMAYNLTRSFRHGGRVC